MSGRVGTFTISDCLRNKAGEKAEDPPIRGSEDNRDQSYNNEGRRNINHSSYNNNGSFRHNNSYGWSDHGYNRSPYSRLRNERRDSRNGFSFSVYMIVDNYLSQADQVDNWRSKGNSGCSTDSGNTPSPYRNRSTPLQDSYSNSNRYPRESHYSHNQHHDFHRISSPSHSFPNRPYPRDNLHRIVSPSEPAKESSTL